MNEEKVNVYKREVPHKEAALIKETVTEIKTMEVTLTYEELIVERRPPTEATTSQHELKPSVTTREEIKIPLKREEVEVKKEPYVKEEVAIKKRRMDERKTIPVIEERPNVQKRESTREATIPACFYSETSAHKYFVSKETELYLKYRCSLNGLVVCFIGENMYPLCEHHHQRVIQWHQEIDPDTRMECRSVWDIK
jgi:uncharacterized protein (TIGR02271 family)